MAQAWSKRKCRLPMLSMRSRSQAVLWPGDELGNSSHGGPPRHGAGSGEGDCRATHRMNSRSAFSHFSPARQLGNVGAGSDQPSHYRPLPCSGVQFMSKPTPNLLALLAVAGGLAAAAPAVASATSQCQPASFSRCRAGGYNPCAAKRANPCAAKKANPCAAKKANPCAANPCAAKANPCAANPCAAKANPCAAKANPCAANPCAAKANPCAANPCAAKTSRKPR